MRTLPRGTQGHIQSLIRPMTKVETTRSKYSQKRLAQQQGRLGEGQGNCTAGNTTEAEHDPKTSQNA